jgi:hypothetical protein
MMLTAAATACARDGTARTDPTLFETLSPDRTGITFENRLTEDTTFNILNYLYYYNGGGVAAGDINNDGLPDLYFTSNLGGDKLYLNKGNFRFEDVSERAGVGGQEGWTTGVSMADVNGDGWLDLYVSGVSYLSMDGRNVLYVNDGDGTFTDRTKELGLEHVGYSTQALFFDYDADGDLDMYLLNHSVHTERGVSVKPQRSPRHPRAGDKLFRNDRGAFTDVSERAGIFGGVEGYGLGVVASDFNVDGCIDLFVANDFQENDFLYYNNCDGTFRESIAGAMGHTSRFSMGVDAADFNNDGRPDLMVLDMLPEREEILKTSANAESFNVFNLKTRAGYHPQYARNTLQLNRGNGRFSEIGYLAGVFATDWSWSPLFADLDNDGRKDLFITNGIYRRPNDLDYINYVSNEAVQRSLEQGVTRANLALLQRMPQIPLANYAYRNNGDLTFTNVADRWGLAQPGFSNGAAYADLDNDGALDLVVSNLNAPASVLRNRAREATPNHFLRVRLAGDSGNRAGIGAKVFVRSGGSEQMVEIMPTRGFQSSVEPVAHFGLGTAARADTVRVVWPNGATQILANAPANQTLTIEQSAASSAFSAGQSPSVPREPPWFFDATSTAGITFKHAENDFFDYNREPFMPHRLSTEGPALAVGDVNGDGLDDVYLGGAKWQPSELYFQEASGRFRGVPTAAFRADSVAEDVDAVFFDADGDGDQDLYVVTAGNEFSEHDAPPALRDRLYRNDGRGVFARDSAAVPALFDNGSCAVPGDYDGDGDLDLFVGSRVVARQYGLPAKSRLLENDGRGRFRDVTEDQAPELLGLGMVTGAAWIPSEGARAKDLVVVGEWMPVRIFTRRDGRFAARESEALARSHGWWNSVTAADLNDDGREDLVLGNLGLNSYIKASQDQPARLYVHDFGQNGVLKQILTFHKNGVSYPVAGRDEIVRPIPSLRSKFPSYKSFGASRVEDIFPAADLMQARVLEARTFASAVALAQADGGFELRPLPVEAQFAPINATLVADYDGDGRADILAGGNFSGVTPVRGRYDASHGLLLRGDGAGGFAAVDMVESGVAMSGQVRRLARLRSRAGVLIAVARNDEVPLLLRPSPRTPSAKRGPQ